jgi:hypothetical protein
MLGRGHAVLVSQMRYYCSAVQTQTLLTAQRNLASVLSAMASPRDSMTVAIRKLPLSLTRFAVFGVYETTKVLCPMAPKIGCAASIAAGAPAATTKS